MHGNINECPIWAPWRYYGYKTIQFLIAIVLWHVHMFPSLFTSGAESRKQTLEWLGEKTNSFCSLYGLIVATHRFSNDQFTAVVLLIYKYLIDFCGEHM